MMADDFFEATAHNLGEAHFIFGGKSLSFAKKRIGDLDLCFYHDGILPSTMKRVNFQAMAFLGST